MIFTIILIVGGILWGVIYYKGVRHQKTSNPIKIGATLALTGNLSYIGEAERNGLQMALEEMNAKNIRGPILQLITEDNQGNAAPAVSSIKKLLDVDRVDMVFSAFTHITNAVKDEVAKHHTLMIYASSVKDIAKSNELFFRDYLDAQDQGRAAAQLARYQNNKHVAFLTEKSDQCSEFEQAMKNELENDGVALIKKEEYLPTEKDLKTQLLKLSLVKPDAIIACSWRHEVILMNQLKELNLIHIPVIHFLAPFLPASNTPEMKKLYSENGSLTTWYGFGEGESHKEKEQEFRDAYKKRFSSAATPDAAYAYDDIIVLSQALEKCGVSSWKESDIECVKEQLLQTHYDGAAGKLEFNHERVSTRDVVGMKAVSGVWNEVSLQ